MNDKAAFRIGYNCPCGRHDTVMHVADRPTVAWRRCPMCERFLRVYVAPVSDVAEVQTFDMPLGDDEQPEIA